MIKVRIAATIAAICHAMCSPDTAAAISARQTASRKYPLEALQALNKPADEEATIQQAMANAVLDKETGQLLEYRQLIKHPQYKQPLLVSSANKFSRLA